MVWPLLTVYHGVSCRESLRLELAKKLPGALWVLTDLSKIRGHWRANFKVQIAWVVIRLIDYSGAHETVFLAR